MNGMSRMCFMGLDAVDQYGSTLLSIGNDISNMMKHTLLVAALVATEKRHYGYGG
jgi:hypothetical protein